MPIHDRDPPGFLAGRPHLRVLPGKHFRAYRSASVAAAMVEWGFDMGCKPNTNMVLMAPDSKGIPMWQETPCYWVRTRLVFPVTEQGFQLDMTRSRIEFETFEEGFEAWGGDDTSTLMRKIHGQCLMFGTLEKWIAIAAGVNPPEVTLMALQGAATMLNWANEPLSAILAFLLNGMSTGGERYLPPEAACAHAAHDTLAKMIGHVKNQKTVLRYRIETDSSLG